MWSYGNYHWSIRARQSCWSRCATVSLQCNRNTAKTGVINRRKRQRQRVTFQESKDMRHYNVVLCCCTTRVHKIANITHNYMYNYVCSQVLHCLLLGLFLLLFQVNPVGCLNTIDNSKQLTKDNTQWQQLKHNCRCNQHLGYSWFL